MEYEILISGKSKKLIHYQEKAKASWGKKEIEPAFYKRDYDGTPDEMEYIKNNCEYDFNQEQFNDNTYNCTHEATNIIKKEEYEIEDLNVEAVLELNDDITVANPCDYLDVFPHITVPEQSKIRPQIVEEDNITNREYQHTYFYNLFFPLRKNEGMKKFLWSINNCEYGQIRKIMKALPQETKIALKEVMSQEDKDAFKNGWGFD